LTISLGFGAYFASNVLTPLWLQNYMGYTATWSGMTTAAVGCAAVFAAPFAARFSQKVDQRYLVFGAMLWIGMWTFIRSFANTDIAYGQIALPLLFQGFGMPFFFVPLTGLALSSVRPEETASAAGLQNFLRTLSGAVATSIVTTSWENDTSIFRTDVSTHMATPLQLATTLGNTSPAGQQLAGGLLENLLQNQTIMMATNHIFQIAACCFVFAACAIWWAPRPKRKADTSAAH
jgi:DHA2 family multidrug resistance protein